MTEIPLPEKPQIFEKNYEALKEQVLKYKELPESHGMGGEEIVKNSIKELLPPPAGATVEPPKEEEISSQAQDLVAIAFENGIYEAHKIAQKYHPYVMDQFHDALTGQFYPELKKRGIVE